MPTTRRSFAGSAGAALLYKVMGPKPTLQAAGPNDRIALGFIGAGIRGSYLLNGFRKMPGVQPVVLADLYDGHLQWAKEVTEGAIATTKDYREVIHRKDIDAVVIATPDHWHAPMVLEALAAGKHVYCEKPLTWSISEGPQIVAAQKKSGKLVMVGSQSKTGPATVKAREIVKSGVLGKINMVRMGGPSQHRRRRVGLSGAARLHRPKPLPGSASWAARPKHAFDPKRFFRWRCWWDYSGGVATDLWVHLLTALHEMMDVQAPKSVVVQGGIYRWDDGRSVPDLLSAVFEYDGFLANVYSNLGNTQANSGIAIMGSEGTLTFTRRGDVLVTFEPGASPVAWYGLNGWPKALREQYLESLGYGGGKRPEAPPAKPPQEIKIERGLEHYEYFIQSLREGKPSRESAEDGHHAAGGAHLANMAFRKGRRLTVGRRLQ